MCYQCGKRHLISEGKKRYLLWSNKEWCSHKCISEFIRSHEGVFDKVGRWLFG